MTQSAAIPVPTRAQCGYAILPLQRAFMQTLLGYHLSIEEGEGNREELANHFFRAASALGLRVSAELAAGGLGCRSCGRPYSKGPDLVVSDENWAKIEPPIDASSGTHGVLCPNCMNDAFEALGAPYGSVEAAFTSGPFANKNWKKPTAQPAAQQPQSDLVKRLRHPFTFGNKPVYDKLQLEAADRIEALEAAAAQPSREAELLKAAREVELFKIPLTMNNEHLARRFDALTEALAAYDTPATPDAGREEAK